MNTKSKKFLKGIAFYTILFCSIMLIFWLQSKYEKKRIEDNLNGVCRETGSILSLAELYDNAVYDYIKNKIKKNQDEIDKFDRCKEDKCGVYYVRNGYDLALGIKMFGLGYDSKLINLVNIDFNKELFQKENINAIYSRDIYGSGTVYSFTKIYSKDESEWFTSEKELKEGIGNYHLGFTQEMFDKDGNVIVGEVFSFDFKNKLTNCGNLAYFF